MTEPGYVAPSPTGWWRRKDRIGVNENETDWVTTTSGVTPEILYKPVMRIANPNVGPQAMRNKFRRKPRSLYARTSATFDSIGGTYQGLILVNGTASISHTVGSGATCVLAPLLTFSAGYATVTATATYAGQAMTQLGMVRNFTNDGTYGGEFFLFGYVNTTTMPTGTQTIQITYANNGGYNDYTSLGSVAYRGVAAFGTCTTVTGSGAACSQTVTATPGDLVFNCFAKWTATFANYTQTQRLNIPYSAGNGEAIVAGDGAATTTSVTFGTNEASMGYAGIGVPLQPITS